jgi:regulator of PEP synthase PpsR (kinase-PPPase family)
MVETKPSPIYIVSGGVGASGEQLVYTVLAQFPGSRVPVITVSYVRQPQQIEDVVARAHATCGTIVHTLVDGRLRGYLVQLAQERGVVAIDLMGALMSRLAELLEQEPAGHPGLYRQLHQDYFERVASIDFAMAHDDGRNPNGWPLADVVLVGPSRVGKTPLSMYLSVLGWKVANVPLVMGLAPPPELFQLDPRRVVGLNIEPGQLLGHRQQRQRHLGAPGPTAYTDPATIYEEIEAARQVFKRGGFSTIDVTDKPIEASADEIIALITRRFGTEAHRGE